jgi:hypothetical protein
MSRELRSSRPWVFVLAFAFLTASLSWAQVQGPEALGFKKHFVIEIGNPGPLLLADYPLVLKTDEIRSAFPDFNSYNYAIFDETGGGYRFVASQADDLNGDRVHDEIVLVRTLLPASVTRLSCYYSPKGSFQLMMTTPKASARLAGNPANPFLAWESNLAAFKFVDGRIEVYGKLYEGLILNKLPADDTVLGEWGMNLLGPGISSGLGGLSLGDGKSRLPLMNSGGQGALRTRPKVLAAGPLRALAKVEFSGVRLDGAEYEATLFVSAFADNPTSRQDVVITRKPAGPIVFSAGVEKLADESVTFDRAKGFLASWGRSAGRAGQIGLAAFFVPADFAGLDQNGPDRSIQLKARSGAKETYWTMGGWEKGIISARPPAAEDWARTAADFAQKLLAKVVIRYKAS